MAVLLAVIAVLLTFFPPPSLPLRYLPGAAALILASMLTWHLRQGFHMDRHRQTVRVGENKDRASARWPNHKWRSSDFSNAQTGRWARENGSRGLGCSLLESDGSEACSPYGR